MMRLHYKDPIGPIDMLGSHADPRVLIRARRPYLIERVTAQKLLSRQAADPVLAADKQQFLELWHACMLVSRQCRRQREPGCAPNEMLISCKRLFANLWSFVAARDLNPGGACSARVCRLH
jgi:hypothetical protein